MGDFNRGRGGFGGGGRGGGFRGGRGGGDRDRRPVTMHKAICSKCNKDCEIPFRPTGDRPVFCNDCFGKSGNAPERSFGRSNFENRGVNNSRDKRNSNSNTSFADQDTKKILESINNKLEKLINIASSLTQKTNKEKGEEMSEAVAKVVSGIVVEKADKKEKKIGKKKNK